MQECIVVEDAVKRFRDVTALDHVSLSLERGKIHGIIGRNGSGKSVLFKCICAFMYLDSGNIYVEGKKVRAVGEHEMGILIENPGFISSMSGYQNLKMLADIKRKIGKEDIRNVMDCVGLDPDNKKSVGKYSKGMKQRLGIAQAIMESPDILILDEPMNGLDRRGVEEIRSLLSKLREEGKTILLTSHYSEDINFLCDTICELDGGRVINSQVIDKKAGAVAES